MAYYLLFCQAKIVFNLKPKVSEQKYNYNISIF
jgi:hypothetical protein